ncbi:MAG: carboxypeptidase-like regulatory domain-containing protein [Planctomycetota bacterium]
MAIPTCLLQADNSQPVLKKIDSDDLCFTEQPPVSQHNEDSTNNHPNTDLTNRNRKTRTTARGTTRQDAQRATVFGRVFDADGNPVAEASVLVDKFLKSTGRVSKIFRTNETGDFRLEFDNDESYTDSSVLWIHGEGHGVRALLLDRLFEDANHAEGLEIRLPRSDMSTFRILDPNGAPVAGAMVVPSVIDLHCVRLIKGEAAIDESPGVSGTAPDELLPIIGRRTNDDGIVELDSVPPRSFSGIDVLTKAHGTQVFSVYGTTPTFRLRKTGEIRGKVLIDTPEAAEGTLFLIETNAFGAPNGRGRAFVELDRNGEFHVPSIAEGGRLSVAAIWDDQKELHPRLDPNGFLKVVAGEVLELEINTCRPVIVNGSVLTEDTREPVRGAVVYLNCLSSPINGVRATTDREGRFTLPIAPGTSLQSVVSFGENPSLKEKYDYPRLEKITIADDIEDLELAPFLLPRKQIVNGVLLDSQSKPLAGKTIIFQHIEFEYIKSRAVTNSSGEFSVGVSEWKIINSSTSISNRYKWLILDQEIIQRGTQVLETKPLTVKKIGPNRLVLQAITP